MGLETIAAIWRSSARSFRWFVARALLFFCAMAADCLAFPRLFSLQIVIAVAFFVIVVARQREKFGGVEFDRSLSAVRIALFCACQAGIIYAASTYNPDDGVDGTVGGFLAPALRLLVPLSGIALLPIGDWKKVVTSFRAEAIAALVILFTFFPYRIADFIWNHGASRVLNTIVYALLVPFFRDAFLTIGSPTLVGTVRYSGTLIIGCSGLNEVFLFQEILGVFLLLEWKRLIPMRALQFYALGIATMLVSNVFRLVLVLSVGTLWPDAAETVHANAGWFLFVPVIAALLSRKYSWLLGRDKESPDNFTLSAFRVA